MKRLAVISLGFAWLFVVVTGTSLFWIYENKAGVASASPKHWPVESQLARSQTQPTLIIIAHPHCPCSRATIRELARLMSSVEGKLSTYMIFVVPAGVDPGWELTDSLENAQKIPGVTVFVDNLGVEALRFDAHTSGQTMLYGSSGELLFSGGITVGRAQEGESIGRKAILDYINGETLTNSDTNVFGCPLLANEAYCHVKRQDNYEYR